MINQPILLTGSHKSGKSFVANGIALTKKVNIIYEPMNLNTRIGLNGYSLQYWYQYIYGENEAFKREFEKTLQFKYRVIKDFLAVRTARSFVKGVRLYKDNWKKRHNRQGIPLVDDPFAVLSAEWFYQNFNMKTIIMIRHPASFIFSLKEKNWTHPFQHFLDQPELMQTKLSSFQEEIEEFSRNPKDIIEQGILLWRIIYSVIGQFKEQYNKIWYFARFEDFADNPIDSFRNLFQFLNIDFDEETLLLITHYLQNPPSNIKIHCSEKNKHLHHEYSIGEQKHYFRYGLTQKEIDYIKEKTHDVWPLFYTEADW